VHAATTPPGVELEPLPDPNQMLERAREQAPLVGIDASALGSPPEVTGEPVLCHGDTKPEHFILDSDDRLAWLVDWADACLAHPVRDLWGVVLWLGPTFAMLVDPDHAAAATFYARCSAVVNVARDLRGEWDAPPVYAQLRAAFDQELP
jgi:aminoglycoside phosphotransferase (APT) family kinase protein